MPSIWNNLKEKIKDIIIIDFGKAEKLKPRPPIHIKPEPIPVPKPVEPPEVDK